MLGVTTSGAAEEGLRHVVTCFVRRVARGLSRREGSRRDARRGPASARASVRSPVVAGDVRRAAARRCPHASAHRGRHTHHVPDALRTCDGDARADRRVVRVARLARTSPWASVETCRRGGEATTRRGQAAAAVESTRTWRRRLLAVRQQCNDQRYDGNDHGRNRRSRRRLRRFRQDPRRMRHRTHFLLGSRLRSLV